MNAETRFWLASFMCVALTANVVWAYQGDAHEQMAGEAIRLDVLPLSAEDESDITAGARHEDDWEWSDLIWVPRYRHHGYNPVSHAFFSTPWSDEKNALERAVELWAEVVDKFRSGERNGYSGTSTHTGGAFHYLGRVSHMLHDMASPGHAHAPDGHGGWGAILGYDYESYWSSFASLGVSGLMTPIDTFPTSPSWGSKMDSVSWNTMRSHFHSAVRSDGLADYIDVMALITYHHTRFRGEVTASSTPLADTEDPLSRMFHGRMSYNAIMNAWFIDGVGWYQHELCLPAWWPEVDPPIGGGDADTVVASDKSAVGYFYFFATQDQRDPPEDDTSWPEMWPNGDLNASHKTLAQYYGEVLIPIAVKYNRGLLNLANRRLAVQSSPNSVIVEASRTDNFGNQNGHTPFSRYYVSGESVTLTVPIGDGQGNDFTHWLKDGQFYANNRSIDVTVGNSAVYTAMYADTAPQPGSDLWIHRTDWDDPDGDNDGVIEGRERVEADITLKNNATVTITNVVATISSSESAIEYFGNRDVDYSAISAGGTSAGDGDYDMQLNLDQRDNCPFSLHVTYEKGGLSYYQDLPFTRTFLLNGSMEPTFSVHHTAMDDDDDRDYNDSFESGEQGRFRIYLENTGSATATNPLAEITAIYPNDRGIEIMGDYCAYPDVAPGDVQPPEGVGHWGAVIPNDFSGAVTADLLIHYGQNQELTKTVLGAPLFTVGAVPLIQVDPAQWSFGLSPTTQDVVKQVTVRNRGTAVLQITGWTVSHGDASFTGDPPPWNIPVASSKTGTVTIDTDLLSGQIERTVTFQSNGRLADPTPPSDRVTITGIVSDVPAAFQIPDVTDAYNPDASANLIVWNSGSGDIGGYDLETNTKFDVCTEAAYQDIPRISGNLVAWNDERNNTGSGITFNGDVYAKDLANPSVEIPIATSAADEILIGVDGACIAFLRHDFTYDSYGWPQKGYNVYYVNVDLGQTPAVVSAPQQVSYYTEPAPGGTLVTAQNLTYECDFCDNVITWQGQQRSWVSDPGTWNDGYRAIIVKFTIGVDAGPVVLQAERGVQSPPTTAGGKVAWAQDVDSSGEVMGDDQIMVWPDGITVPVPPDYTTDHDDPVLGCGVVVYDRNWIDSRLYYWDFAAGQEFAATDNLVAGGDWRMDCYLLVWRSGGSIFYTFLNLADISVSGEDIGFGSTSPVEGVNIDVTVTVHNIGTVDTSDDITVQLYDGDPGNGGVEIAPPEVIEGGIVKGGEEPVEFTGVTVPIEGTHEIFVTISRAGQDNPSNNEASRTLNVQDSDTTGPVISNVAVTEENGDGDGFIGEDEEIRISWQLSDPSGISSTSLTVDGEPVSLDGNYYAVFGPKEAGPHEFTINATDDDTSREDAVPYTDTFAVVTAEEITVLYNGEPVVNGATIDFGQVQVGGTLERTFVIRNDGEQTLTLGAIGAPIGFNVTGPASVTVPPSTHFVVAVDTAAAGTPTGTLSIPNSDADFAIEVSATVVEKRLLTVETSPFSGVDITGTPAGTTTYTSYRDPNSPVTLTADSPVMNGGTNYEFTLWQVNGVDQPLGQRTITFNIAADTTARAIYRTELTPPSTSGHVPAKDAIQVPRDTIIQVDITDGGSGVDTGTVSIQAKVGEGDWETISDGSVEYDASGNANLPGTCRRSGTAADYTYLFEHPSKQLDYEKEVSIRINAGDNAGNAMTQEEYSFTTVMRSFGRNVRISQDAGLHSHPSTAVDAAGNIWVAWETNDGGQYDIFAAKLPLGAASFDSPIIHITDDPGDERYPTIAAGSDGGDGNVVCIAWKRTSDASLWATMSNDVGETWTTGLVSANGVPYEPQAAMMGDTPAIAWSSDLNIFVAQSNGDTWNVTPAVTGLLDNEPEIQFATDWNGGAWLAWTDGYWTVGERTGYAAHSSNWSLHEQVIDSDTVHPCITGIWADTDGCLHIVWEDTNGTEEGNVRYTSTVGLPAEPLTGACVVDEDSRDAMQMESTIAASSQGVFIAWTDMRNGWDDWDIYFTEAALGSTNFGTDIFVNDDRAGMIQMTPAIGVDGSGSPYLVWADERSGTGIPYTYAGHIYFAGATDVLPPEHDDGGASKPVEAAVGGIVEVENGGNGGNDGQCDNEYDARVDIPSGALPCDTTITISRLTHEPEPPAGGFGVCFDFGPSGLEFNSPVTITIPHKADLAHPGDIQVYWYDERIGLWSQDGISDVEHLPTTGDVYGLHWVSFQTIHFSTFGVGGSSSGGGGGSGPCFLATAAYGGDPMLPGELVAGSVDPENLAKLNTLRAFRDDLLLHTNSGRRFTAWYYAVSPPMAEEIHRLPLAKTAVRCLLINPLAKLVAPESAAWDAR